MRWIGLTRWGCGASAWTWQTGILEPGCCMRNSIPFPHHHDATRGGVAWRKPPCRFRVRTGKFGNDDRHRRSRFDKLTTRRCPPWGFRLRAYGKRHTLRFMKTLLGKELRSLGTLILAFNLVVLSLSAAERVVRHEQTLLLAREWNPSVDPTGWWVSESARRYARSMGWFQAVEQGRQRGSRAHISLSRGTAEWCGAGRRALDGTWQVRGDRQRGPSIETG